MYTQESVVQFSHSVMSNFLPPHGLQHPMDSLSITKSRSLLKLMSIELVMPSNHLILCCPLLLLPSIFPSIRVFSSESVLHIRWPRYQSFNFSISCSLLIKLIIFLCHSEHSNASSTGRWSGNAAGKHRVWCRCLDFVLRTQLLFLFVFAPLVLPTIFCTINAAGHTMKKANSILELS